MKNETKISRMKYFWIKGSFMYGWIRHFPLCWFALNLLQKFIRGLVYSIRERGCCHRKWLFLFGNEEQICSTNILYSLLNRSLKMKISGFLWSTCLNIIFLAKIFLLIFGIFNFNITAINCRILKHIRILKYVK